MSVDAFIKIHSRANQLLREHGLAQQGWTFEFSDQKKRVGECNFSQKKIRFSRYFMKSDWAEIEDTLLHEIAHALVGVIKTEKNKNDWHGYDWQMMALKIGANPQRTTGAAVNSAKYNYVIKCPSCGRQWKRYRMRARNLTAKCPTCLVQVVVYKYRR